MEYDCFHVKRRKILPENHVDHSESNRDINKEDILNSKLVVKQGCAINDVKESLMDGIQNDRFDHGEENKKSKDKVVMEESKLDATDAHGNQSSNEDNSSSDNGHSHLKEKLLVLDVNGLLVDIVAKPDKAYRPHIFIASKAVFKRPFCKEFLTFCFERFKVGIWTSRTRRNIERLLQFLEIETFHQLLFCWDQSCCTETGFNTIEKSEKPLVLKELKKLWEKQDPSLPWDKGVYNESNTILLDDSPYKALRNPPFTAIFPNSYCYTDTKDNGLGPNGDLRNYLERLAASDNVQNFIEQNPFGQQPITKDHESWYFYSEIVVGRKLVVMDIDGLLVDIATVVREGFIEDTMHGSKAVFKRPYCDEFLHFCIKRFNIGVWTSTSRYNTESILDFLLGDDMRKLLFYWVIEDRSHCTVYTDTQNNRCSLIVKELRNIWEKKDPNLPWEIGAYDESNTILVESTPHRALLNPQHTAIFPYPYRYWRTEDNALGPNGDLRVYLERLAASKNVQEFVSKNPFGQRPNREKNLSCEYFLKVTHAFPSKFKLREPTTSDAQTSLELQTKTTTTILEPETDTTTLDAQTSSVPETDTISSKLIGTRN